jgi:periplasmic protein TonB
MDFLHGGILYAGMNRIIPLSLLLTLFTVVVNAQTEQPIHLKPGESITIYDSTDDSRATYCSMPDLEAYYPGGDGAWMSFLKRNLVYPKAAKRKKIEGTVLLCFKVGKDSSIHELEVISGPKELQQSALDLMKKIPKWAPAIVRGRRVESYVNQSIVFKCKDK